MPPSDRLSANDPKRTGCSRKWLNHQISEADRVLDPFGQVNRKRTRLPLNPEQLRRAGVCVQRNGDVASRGDCEVVHRRGGLPCRNCRAPAGGKSSPALYCQATATSSVFSQDANISICARSAMDSLSASCLGLDTYPVASRVHGGLAARRDLGAITTHGRAEAEVSAEYPSVAG